MKELNEIRDDQIRIVGESVRKNPLHRRHIVVIVLLSIVAAVGVGIFFLDAAGGKSNDDVEVEIAPSEPLLFEPEKLSQPANPQWIGSTVDSLSVGFTEILDTLVNDIGVRIFIPHNAEMSLHVGNIDISDTTVVYAAQAADIRADNGDIVGAFVLKGEPKAWGLSKKGFCALIDGEITIGVADNTSLFEKAIERGGYFFRQYPLVDNGRVVDNEPKGKSVRRAICNRYGEIFMVESLTKESFHDFAQALCDFGVNHAVYLVGSSAFGWAVDSLGATHEFGDKKRYAKRGKLPKNTSYIVWRKK